MQKLGGEPVLQISLKLCGAVEIQQRPALPHPQRQQAKPLPPQDAVEVPNVGRKLPPRLVLARKKASGLDPGQRRRRLPDKQFL